jgi:hypothetical protein
MGLFSMIAGEGQAAVTVSQSLLDSMTTVASDCLTFLSSALPIALPVLGAGIVVGFGIKTFKKVTSKA